MSIIDRDLRLLNIHGLKRYIVEVLAFLGDILGLVSGSLHENAILIVFRQLQDAWLIVLLSARWSHRLLHEVMLLKDLLFILRRYIGLQMWLKRDGLLF